MSRIGAHGGFRPVRDLLNPKFESYKLSAIDQAKVLSSHALPVPVAAPPVPNSVFLPFHDVEYRIRHNHLAACPGGRLVYVSAAYEVIGVSINPTTLELSFSTIVRLRSPIQPQLPLYSEYPAVYAISGNVLVVSDGSGQLHVVEAVSPDGSGDGVLLGSYLLSSVEAGNAVPFRMHHAGLDGPDSVYCIISVSTRVASTDASSSKHALHEKTTYQLMKVRFKLPKQPHAEVQYLEVEWAITGDSLPLLFIRDAESHRYIIASATPFNALSAPALPPDPEADEIAPIPRPDENMNDIPSLRDAKPPPYSWTQTHDSVTVVFPLPASTSKTSIRVLLAAQNLTLLISDRDQRAAFPFPVYVRKPFWDGIHADTSYWTWDREGDKPGASVGLLSLHLDKLHEGTRWAHVFASSGTGTGLEEDEEVPETVDPSELANIREDLEKWTASLASGDDASGLGMGKGVSSLMDGEMDEELDERVGSRVVLTYVSDDGHAECPAPQAPVDLLSVPFPNTLPSIVIKHTLDGLLFTTPSLPSLSPDPADPSPPPSAYEWTHASTFPALAFVLASKRDVKYTFHHGASVVLAFEGGTGKGTSVGGNVYVYRGAEGRRSAGQAVLRVSGGSAGALMGVQAVALGGGQGEGREVLVCLCENELVVVRDILSW